MAGRSQSYWAIAFGMIAWSLLLFSPLALVGTVQAQDAESEYGTVIGIVSQSSRGCYWPSLTKLATLSRAAD